MSRALIQVLLAELSQLYDTYCRDLGIEMDDITGWRKDRVCGLVHLFALDYGILEAGWASYRLLSSSHAALDSKCADASAFISPSARLYL